MSAHKKTAAVVIIFHPKIGTLLRLLDALEAQVRSVVIVDNGSNESTLRTLSERNKVHEHLIPMGSNRGIAAAQNAGISWARQQECEYVILFDQDSFPPPNLIEVLYEAAEEKIAEGVQVAAVGPRYVDKRRNDFSPFIRFQGLRIERPFCTFANEVIEVDYLIASGCLIPLNVLHQIGDMHEELFIDYVDIEWGLRAKFHGLHSFGVCGAVMNHNLGEEPISILKYKFSSHSPLRHYYQFRNAIWMYRQPWLPLNWKLIDGGRLLLRYGLHTLLATPRLEHLRMMSLGIWHGLTGRMGQLV